MKKHTPPCLTQLHIIKSVVIAPLQYEMIHQTLGISLLYMTFKADDHVIGEHFIPSAILRRRTLT